MIAHAERGHAARAARDSRSDARPSAHTLSGLTLLLEAEHRLACAAERQLWETSAYYVRRGLPLSTALRILGCSRATWYRKTAEFRREEEM